ncbi:MULTISPECIES: hypothetical protein [Bradyrhizobium]|jgi:hypothetical protein|uniref:hypothetical protein n=1 Tax=Bradyrhizobium TaxID=374 RepID=UPI0004B05C08|nr:MULTISPECIES: hypothetical protein [Bradyrhizobium]MDI2110301.1 hypothetical protein [Bradyrhizobium sp. Mp64]WLB04463.1 hypothetical protein QNJ80_21725 [Bradyrhizobium elkanii]
MAVRIYIDASRVTVSKPGYDAQFPPAVDYKYLALDSRLNQGRPLEIGILPSYSFLVSGKVFYSTTYATPPGVDIVAYGVNSSLATYQQSLVMRDVSGSNAIQRVPFAVLCETNGFTATDAGLVNSRHSRFYGANVTLFYVAWQVQ